MRFSLRRTLIGLSACILIGLLASWGAGDVMVRGHRTAVPAASPPARAFQLRATDGVTLAATYWPGVRTDAPAVLLLHGVDGSRATVARNAAWLAQQGYAAMAIDFRGHGQSETVDRSFGWNEGRDAHAAFAWLKRQQRGAPVAVIGYSMGGAASLVGPAGPVPADAMILQAVYPDIRDAIRHRIATRLGEPLGYVLEPLLSLQARLRFGVWPSAIAPIDAIRRYDGPVMVIGGMQDRSTPPEESRALFAAAPGKRKLWMLPTGGHASASSSRTDPEYHARILAFLHATIGQP
jgi:pimeloyl-ACP methyl ester carboxylesterase